MKLYAGPAQLGFFVVCWARAGRNRWHNLTVLLAGVSHFDHLESDFKIPFWATCVYVKTKLEKEKKELELHLQNLHVWH
jgi:hypothetical protein